MANSILDSELNIINIGSSSFTADYEKQGLNYDHIEWKVKADGNVEVMDAIKKIIANRFEIEKANQKALNNIKSSSAKLIGVAKALDVIPNMTSKTILHSGPSVLWENMAGPMKGAIIGALIYEGLAKNEQEAIELASSGDIIFDPCHEHNCVGPMAGIISPSMPVHVIYNEAFDSYAYATINEGLGKVLRYGANSQDVIERLKWIETSFAPVVNMALGIAKGIDIKAITTQALQMGDECHNRNKAATALFLREIVPAILKVEVAQDEKEKCIQFIIDNEHYFLNLSMPMCKVMLDTINGIDKCSILSVMARNGVEFGIKVSGVKDKWFTGPANFVEGLYFTGYTQDDAALDIGDSAITETFGIGGFCMGASPAIVKFVGGSLEDALEYTSSMYNITSTENIQYMLPAIDFRGIPQGIDIIKVIDNDLLPVINTGIAHKEAGVGQIGAGVVRPPKEVFIDAIIEFAKTL